VVAFLMLVLAVADLWFAGDLTGALWLLLIAWFLDSSAKREAAGEHLRFAVTGVRVGEAMSQPATVPSWITVQLLLQQSAGRPLSTGFLTHGLSGEPEGLVTVQALRMVPPARRGTTRVGEIAVPLSSLPTASPGDLLSELLPRLSMPNGGRALVLEQGRMVGMISPADVANVLMRGQHPPVAAPPHAMS
jgi:signal-transduction protein with cAMP-binding, CBS, and nucleotidyltransferase domain